MKDFNVASVEIAKILLSGLEKNTGFQITYATLGNMLVPPHGAQTMNDFLYELSKFCEDNMLPLISVVVVRQSDSMPGKGFFKDFFGSTTEDDNYKNFAEESEKVYKCKDWSPLKRKLGLL